MLVQQYFEDSSHGHFYKALAFFIGYCGTPVISLKFFVKYLALDSIFEDYNEFEVEILVRKTSLYDVKSYPQHGLIFTHQITRYASFDAWNERAEIKQDRSNVFETSIARIFEVLTSELASKHDPSTNQMVEYTSSSLKVVDVVMSLVLKMREKQLDLHNVIKKEFCWVFLDSMTEAKLYWPNSHKSAVIMPTVEFLVDMVEESFEKGNVEIALLLSVLYFHNTGNKESTNLEKIVRMNEDFARSSLSHTDQYPIEKIVFFNNMMGIVYRGSGKCLSKAQEFHQIALDLSENHGLKNEKAISLHLLGIIHRYQSNLKKALLCHEEAVELGRQIFSPQENGRLAAFILNLAVVYTHLAKFEKAREAYEETLELAKIAYGSHDQRVARILNCLSEMYSSLGKYRESVEVALQALGIHEEIHGDFHPNVAQTLFVLGIAYRFNGDLQKSREVLLRSLKILRQYYGNEHSQVGEVLHDLSNTQRELNMFKDALENANRCIDIFRNTSGEKSSPFATALNGLGRYYLAIGDPITAQTNFEKALAIFKKLKKKGFQGQRISETKGNIAQALKRRGETTIAKKYVSSALDEILKVYSETHPRVQELRELEKELCT
jgi:tetratricopeptide (TPR) repeat protein